MSQEIVPIPIDRLRLWTENPRDPVDTSLTDEEVILRAITNESGNWNLDKLLLEMGNEYHYNELPVVVMIDDSPVVYDGNRRVAVLKCLRSPRLYQAATQQLPIFTIGSLEVPDTLPCDVCDLSTALDIVERLHSGSKRWGRLQYEQFRHIHRGAPMGRLMILDKATGGMVTRTKELNEEYVQNRLLSDANLSKVGLAISGEELLTSNDPEMARQTLEDIGEVMKRGLSNARHNPGNLKAALVELNKERYENVPSFDPSRGVTLEALAQPEKCAGETDRPPRRIRRLKQDGPRAFGGAVLRPNGERSDSLYRAIEWIDEQYRKNPNARSNLLPVLGFSLRLLLDTVAREFFISKNVPVGDQALGKFMKEEVKPYYRNKVDKSDLNHLSKYADWMDGGNSLETILGKWAHGTLDVFYDDFVKQSVLVAEIIKQLHWKS